MNKKKQLFRFLSAAVLIVSGFAFYLFGCNAKKGESLQTEDTRVTVGLSEIDSLNPWSLARITSFINAASDRDYRLIYHEPAERTGLNQIEDIEQMLKENIDYLVVVPFNDDVLNKAAELTEGTEVKLILLETDAQKVTEDTYFTMICTDYYKEGQLCADILKDYFKEREGKILEVVGERESSAAQMRAQGFHDQIKRYGSMKITAEIVGNFDRVTAQKSMEELIGSGNADYNAIIAYSDEDGLGVLQALKIAGLHDENVPIVSINGVQDVLKAIIAKEYYATVESNPDVGTIVMQVIASDVMGYKPAKRIIVPYNIYNSHNAIEQYKNAY